MSGVIIIAGAIVGGIILAILWLEHRQRNAAIRRAQAHLQECWTRYQWALHNMQTDPSARANVVNFGRAYYGALRGAVTVYDEMAISNDIKQAGW